MSLKFNTYTDATHEVLFDMTWGFASWMEKQTDDLREVIMDELNGSRGVFEWLLEQATLFQAQWEALPGAYKEEGNYMEDVDAWILKAVVELAERTVGPNNQ